MHYYGTHLNWLVENVLKDHEHSLSVKEIAQKIHRHENERLQGNLEQRVRRALRQLEFGRRVIRETHRTCRQHISLYKYKINEQCNRQVESP